MTAFSPAAPAAQLLDVEAVAAMLGCSPRHVYRLSDAGRMIDRIAVLLWRQRRLGSVEADMFVHNYHDRNAKQATRTMESLVDVAETWLKESWMDQYTKIITDPEAYDYAQREKSMSELRRDKGTKVGAAAFLGDCGEGFARLHRYETGTQTVYKTTYIRSRPIHSQSKPGNWEGSACGATIGLTSLSRQFRLIAAPLG
jgi:hypothetical protein